MQSTQKHCDGHVQCFLYVKACGKGKRGKIIPMLI
jgi:hypothetical protein